MLDKIRQNYPIGAIILLLLSYINIDYYSESAWSAHFQGNKIGIAVICIIGLILLYQIVDALHALAIINGYLPDRIRYKYDILLPIGVLGLILQSNFRSSKMVREFGISGELVPQWEFRWGGSELAYLLLTLIILVLLLRILAILSAMVRHAQTT